MRKIRFIGSLLLLVLVLSACGNSKFNELVSQAEQHEAAQDYQSAVDVYTKALDIKEDAAARTALNRLTADIEQIKEVKQIVNDLKAQAGTYKNVFSSADLLTLCDDIVKTINRVDTFDTSRNSTATTYIKSLRESSSYFPFTSSVELAQITHSVGITERDAYSDAEEINTSLTQLLNDVPLPSGFAAVN